MIRQNPVRELLHRGSSALGVMISVVRSPEIAVMMASGGFDFFVVDMEHSAMSLESVSDIVMAARATAIAPMVRPPSARSDALFRVLDVGAEGLLVPHVDRREDVEHIISMTKYHPVGHRGMAMSRGQTLFRRPSDPLEFTERANRETILAIQIESLEAKQNLPDMLSVGHIDVAFLGPGDFSHALGLAGQTKHPKVVEAMREVVGTCREHGVAAGTMVHDLKTAELYLGMGVQFLIYSNDISFLVGSARKASEELRSISEKVRGSKVI